MSADCGEYGHPDACGNAGCMGVRFADVEDALRDKQRLAWLLPVIDGSGGEGAADRRTAALTVGLMRGLVGLPLVDAAMADCPV